MTHERNHSVSIPGPTYARLKAAAGARKTAMSWILEDALDAHLPPGTPQDKHCSTCSAFPGRDCSGDLDTDTKWHLVRLVEWAKGAKQ